MTTNLAKGKLNPNQLYTWSGMGSASRFLPMTHVTRKIYFYPRTGLYFRTCEDRAGWHLIPCRISPRSEFFSQAYKNWHIMWGINLGLDWPPLARGSNFHTIHTPTKAASLPPLEQWKIWTSRFRRNNISSRSRQFRFPVWYFKGINGTVLSKIT